MALASISTIMSAIFGLARFGMFRQVFTFAAVSATSSSDRPVRRRCANVGSSVGIVGVGGSAPWSVSSSCKIAGGVRASALKSMSWSNRMPLVEFCDVSA